MGVVDGVLYDKASVSIDLTTARGSEIASALALEADVVCSNFRPGVLDKYGLSVARLRSIKPSLICLQLSGYGTPGPWAEFPAYGPSTEAAGGLNRLLVDEGELPPRIGSGVFTDQLAGRYAALAVVAALRRRSESGEGAVIDLSMSESVTHLLGSLMVQSAMTGQVPKAERNRDPQYVPQGVYPCSGDDQWIAISVTSDSAWQRLTEIVSRSELDEDMSCLERARRHDDIDTVLCKWTVKQNKDELAQQLQACGIAAAPVRTVEDSVQDPQFQARGAITNVRHRKPILGYRAHPHPPIPWRLVGRRRKKLTGYRGGGQDNVTVLNHWLGYAREQVRELEREGVLGPAGSHDIAEPPVRGDRRDPGFARKLGLPR
jgi:crotonobetainyl-CoA:carnitine CoA-transferase CaiB-like acyl-CoA transferase|tara:strand:+ start:7803 stop:8927 length:1125 start_codon:yes stop_codon:yes gene_type:complete